MKRLAPAFLVVTLLLPAALAGASTAPASPELVAVKFHADWCGSCKRMGPVFEDLRNKYDGQPVLFVELDLTNGTTRAQAEYLAAALGFGEVYAANQGTGFILLLDGESRQEVAKLTADQDIKAMGKQIVAQLESR
ncbi:MAG: thioredoxin family protein [Thermoanaerobaculia bacterium]|nr:thioredoxin family protein [Thermoanaerobaculia bacterium]